MSDARITTVETEQLRAEVQRLKAELAEQERSFDLRWDADMRAIKRWQAAHPGNDLVWPDHADMVVWLMEQLDAVRVQRPT